MKAEHQQILETTPEDEPRSRLDPFRELILRWRSQGRTYRRIITLLANRCDVNVAYGPLYRFVKRRSRPRKLRPELDPQIAVETPNVVPTPTFNRAQSPGKLTPEERERQRAILKVLRERSVVTPKEDDDFPIWDPDKPLTNKPSSEEK